MLRHRPHPTWACHGGTWSGERERAAGQSSPAPAPVAAGRSSLARTGGRAELAFACTCGGRGAAALHAHPWRLGRSSPGARSHRLGGACLRPQRTWRSSSARTLAAAGQSSSAPEPTAAGRSCPARTHALPRTRSQPRRPLGRRCLHRPRPCSRTPRCFNPAAGYPPQFPSLCHHRTTPPRRHNPATPFTLHPNWLCQCGSPHSCAPLAPLNCAPQYRSRSPAPFFLTAGRRTAADRLAVASFLRPRSLHPCFCLMLALMP